MEAKLCAVPSLIPAERTFAVHISAPGGWGEEGWLLVLACAVPSACLHGKRRANSSTGLCTLNVKWIVFSFFFLWYNLIVVHIYLRPVNKGTPIKNNNFWFPIGNSIFSLTWIGFVKTSIRGCLWFDLKSGLFCPRLAQNLLCNSTNINNDFGFLIESSSGTLTSLGLSKHPFRVLLLMVWPKVGLILS